MQSLLAVLLSCSTAAQPPVEGKAVRLLARGPWTHLPAHQGAPPGVPQQRALRSERELAQVAGAHALPAVARALGVKGIDFKKHMLIAVTGTRQPLVGVSGGGPPSAPSRVEVARVERDDGRKVLTVSWRFVPRGPEILTAPLAVVLVDRFDGAVHFERLPQAAGPDKAPPGMEVKVLARAFWPDGWKAESPPQQWVIRSYAELIDSRLRAPEPVLERMRRASLARYLKALKVNAIDFDKQMIVGASGGAAPAGTRVEITRIALDGGRMTVHWKLHAPKAAQVAAALTHPAEVVLVERFAGDVRFDPPAPKQALQAPAQEAPAPGGLGQKVANFTLKDATGKAWSPRAAEGTKAVVVVFLSFECPVSNSYAQPLAELFEAYQSRGVAVVGVCPRDEGDARQIARLAREYKLPFPVFRDDTLAAVRALQASVTPEAFVLDAERVLRYRGRIDDGYAARLKKNPKITREDLRLALDDVLAGKPVRQSATRPVGCPIPREDAPKGTAGKVTYHRDVLPILQSNCQQCHRVGGVAPFALMNYRQAVNWAGDIKDYTQARKMPPWKPTEGPGFHGERKLTDKDIATLAAWVDAKAPEGDPRDAPPAPRFPEGWQLGTPDLILTPDEDFQLGASGPDQFRCFVLPVQLDEDKYITAVEVRPGNARVVHHALLLLDRTGQARKHAQLERKLRREKGSDRGPGYSSAMAAELFPNFLSGPWPLLGVWAPGQLPQHVPSGLGYHLPKGSDLVMQIHYSRSGRPEKDRTSIGLYFAKKPAVKPIEGILMVWWLRAIFPGEERCRVTGTAWVDQDCQLYSAFPHMHLIGKEMKLTMTPPGGTAITLITIKDWDFNWQETYYFKKPVRVLRGTRFDVEAYYDNSSKNPNNPNRPPKMVFPGLQTANEMCAVLLEATSDRPGRIWPRMSAPDQSKPKAANK